MNSSAPPAYSASPMSSPALYENRLMNIAAGKAMAK